MLRCTILFLFGNIGVGVAFGAHVSRLELSLFEPQSQVLKGDCIKHYIGDYYRGN